MSVKFKLSCTVDANDCIKELSIAIHSGRAAITNDKTNSSSYSNSQAHLFISIEYLITVITVLTCHDLK